MRTCEWKLEQVRQRNTLAQCIGSFTAPGLRYE